MLPASARSVKQPLLHLLLSAKQGTAGLAPAFLHSQGSSELAWDLILLVSPKSDASHALSASTAASVYTLRATEPAGWRSRQQHDAEALPEDCSQDPRHCRYSAPGVSFSTSHWWACLGFCCAMASAISCLESKQEWF
jgi:hypothetical protein